MGPIIKTVIQMYTADSEDDQALYTRLKGMKPTELAIEMNLLKIDLDRLGEAKTNVQKKYDAIRINMMPSAMDDDGISSITVDGVGRVGLTSDIYASIVSGKKNKAFQWLRDNKHGGLIQETVNAGSLKAAFKRIIKAGKEQIPPDLFKVTPFSRATITKVTK